jgi:hypothetical protein
MVGCFCGCGGWLGHCRAESSSAFDQHRAFFDQQMNTHLLPHQRKSSDELLVDHLVNMNKPDLRSPGMRNASPDIQRLCQAYPL